MKKIALIGKSGAGKDTVKKELCNYIGVIPEVSYTTRPPRLNEIHGVDYNFVCEEKFHSLDMIEKVCFREWWYGTERKEFQKSNVFIFTPSGYRMLPEKERNELFVVLLDVSAKEQEKRIIERGSYEEAELKRRIAADYEDFYDFNEYHIKINTDLLKPSEIAKILIGINE